MNKEKIKIVFVIPSLVAGGAERVISIVSQHISKDKFEVRLLVIGFKKDTVYTVENVQVDYLNQERVLYAIPKIIQYFTRYKPNIVVSSISHLNTVMALVSPYFRNVKFVGRESTILNQRKDKGKKRFWQRFSIFKNQHHKLDRIICQSSDMAQDLINNSQVPANKIVIINNPISKIGNLKKNLEAERDNTPSKYITIGRLTQVKGHLRLLEILSQLDDDFIYTIVGDGELKDQIFQKATDLGLQDKITHIPYTDKTDQILASNDMYLQGSYIEGFPNATLESCVAGVPVIAFNAPGGTKEIIENNINGFIVDSSKDFLKCLQAKNTWNPEQIRSSVVEKFSTDKIIKQYEDLFIEINN
ncbi:glycosyltransferase [Zhouia amylolytica]|uniref:glycosyltransferase n=1 Tax=Zhouia amylolytica TaxID=376730 RepID=UPI0020CE324B|nr:glycosyltransferase [Zhouia amylolytica]MCQ0112283.1 glycosyltransferase [Zhouia amylolytica]